VDVWGLDRLCRERIWWIAPGLQHCRSRLGNRLKRVLGLIVVLGRLTGVGRPDRSTRLRTAFEEAVGGMG
jgi:hypothetical protein